MTDDADRPPSLVDLALSAQEETLVRLSEAARLAATFDDRVDAATSVAVGETPSRVVYTENKLELHRYESLTDDQHDVPILIVYALINRPYILDLQPDRSVVRRLLEAGHDVYLIDWNEPSQLDTALGLDDYVNRYLDDCVDEVRERSGQESINLLGYCMGGTMAAIYTALHPEKVNALGLLAAGLHFDDTGGILERWGDEAYYDPHAVSETFGNVPGEFLDAGFDLMDPVANAVTKYVHLYDRLENEDFVANFARMERWLAEGVDVAGAVYAEFVEAIYQENRLAENELVVGSDRVDVANIDVPLLQILGEYDHLVPPAASKPFNDLVSGEVTTIEYPTGHVGLAMSTGAHRDVWPEVAEWFLEQRERPALADVIGEAVERALGVDVETDVTVGNVDEVELGVADDDGELARAVVRHDARTIEEFLEEALDVDVGVDVGSAGIVVTVETTDDVTTTVVENVGEAIRTEVEEAVDAVAVAAAYDLEDVDGIGPTYAGRLRAAGIETVTALVVADLDEITDATETSETLARKLRDRARTLLGADETADT
ncbi:class III poly(R)-hydroxyalkanoic acid synthase subunit PhaC [Haloplanus litoreus]|uniref:Poly(3-hydroxyalkanoate) polymerase subunit PhaC n=1 Tax=Haloplanus litoreus TaxID=767515 RepID=A0ABD5ZX64_9EURY